MTKSTVAAAVTAITTKMNETAVNAYGAALPTKLSGLSVEGMDVIKTIHSYVTGDTSVDLNKLLKSAQHNARAASSVQKEIREYISKSAEVQAVVGQSSIAEKFNNRVSYIKNLEMLGAVYVDGAKETVCTIKKLVSYTK